MFPFWSPVIAPVLDAAEARLVVEIGALRGDNTRQIIEHLGPGSVLHVIDPVPGFDPTEHEREFPGRYVFHQALSLDVLGSLPPMDAALVDGDHNWYTVRNELRLLREVARAAGAPLPVLVLHDVGWPYGRRDLYYAPETIPAEHRQPHRRAGMRPGRSELLTDDQGMSPGLWNAEVEGGPRNGVMTALDDFIADHDRPLRTLVLPMYFGLAIVVEQERLDRQPALAAALDHIEGAAGSQTLLALGEELRVRAMAQHHTVVRQHTNRSRLLATRYLDRVVDDLIREHPRARQPLVEAHRALAELAPDGPGGRIAVLGRAGAPIAALACAHAVASSVPCGVVVVDPTGAVGPQLRKLTARLDLDAVAVEVVDQWERRSPGPVAVVLDGASDRERRTDRPAPDGDAPVVRLAASGRAGRH